MHKTNTDINTIGGIPDFDMIYDVLRMLAADVSASQIQKAVITDNRYGIRTEEARGRFLRAIKSAFWQFKNDAHKTLIRTLFSASGFEKTKRLALFPMLAVNNPLFENITKHVFIKTYFSGRVQIHSTDIIAYLRHARETDAVVRKWSDTTINTVASKYLTFLKKIDFVTGRQKKTFKYIRVDNTSLIFFIYLLKAADPDQADIFKNRYCDFLLIEKESLLNILKKATFSPFFDIQTSGTDLKINLKCNYGELIHVISSRT